MTVYEPSHVIYGFEKNNQTDYPPLHTLSPYLCGVNSTGILTGVPGGGYDDGFFCLRYALRHPNAVILTCDRFKDWMGLLPTEARPDARYWLRHHALTYTFTGSPASPPQQQQAVMGRVRAGAATSKITGGSPGTPAYPSSSSGAVGGGASAATPAGLPAPLPTTSTTATVAVAPPTSSTYTSDAAMLGALLSGKMTAAAAAALGITVKPRLKKKAAGSAGEAGGDGNTPAASPSPPGASPVGSSAVGAASPLSHSAQNAGPSSSAPLSSPAADSPSLSSAPSATAVAATAAPALPSPGDNAKQLPLSSAPSSSAVPAATPFGSLAFIPNPDFKFPDQDEASEFAEGADRLLDLLEAVLYARRSAKAQYAAGGGGGGAQRYHSQGKLNQSDDPQQVLLDGQQPRQHQQQHNLFGYETLDAVRSGGGGGGSGSYAGGSPLPPSTQPPPSAPHQQQTQQQRSRPHQQLGEYAEVGSGRQRPISSMMTPQWKAPVGGVIRLGAAPATGGDDAYRGAASSSSFDASAMGLDRSLLPPRPSGTAKRTAGDRPPSPTDAAVPPSFEDAVVDAAAAFDWDLAESLQPLGGEDIFARTSAPAQSPLLVPQSHRQAHQGSYGGLQQQPHPYLTVSSQQGYDSTGSGGGSKHAGTARPLLPQGSGAPSSRDSAGSSGRGGFPPSITSATSVTLCGGEGGPNNTVADALAAAEATLRQLSIASSPGSLLGSLTTTTDSPFTSTPTYDSTATASSAAAWSTKARQHRQGQQQQPPAHHQQQFPHYSAAVPSGDHDAIFSLADVESHLLALATNGHNNNSSSSVGGAHFSSSGGGAYPSPHRRLQAQGAWGARTASSADSPTPSPSYVAPSSRPPPSYATAVGPSASPQQVSSYALQQQQQQRAEALQAEQPRLPSSSVWGRGKATGGGGSGGVYGGGRADVAAYQDAVGFEFLRERRRPLQQRGLGREEVQEEEAGGSSSSSLTSDDRPQQGFTCSADATRAAVADTASDVDLWDASF